MIENWGQTQVYYNINTICIVSHAFKESVCFSKKRTSTVHGAAYTSSHILYIDENSYKKCTQNECQNGGYDPMRKWNMKLSEC